jgi:hypothetical protein
MTRIAQIENAASRGGLGADQRKRPAGFACAGFSRECGSLPIRLNIQIEPADSFAQV